MRSPADIFNAPDHEIRRQALIETFSRIGNDLSALKPADILFEDGVETEPHCPIYDDWNLTDVSLECLISVADEIEDFEDDAQIVPALISFTKEHGSPWKEVGDIRIYHLTSGAVAIDEGADKPQLAGVWFSAYNVDSSIMQGFVAPEYRGRGLSSHLFETFMVYPGLAHWFGSEDYGKHSAAGTRAMLKAIETVWEKYALHEITDAAAYLRAAQEKDSGPSF